jgi:hypothetical protein
MDYKKEMLEAIKTLDSYGVSRREIERRLNKREFWLDQALSKGGNKQAFASLKLLIDSVVKSNTAPILNEPTAEYISSKSIDPTWQEILRLSLAALLRNDDTQTTMLNKLVNNDIGQSENLRQILANQAQQGQQVAKLQSEILSRLSSIQLAVGTRKGGQERAIEKDTVSGKSK